MNPKERFVKTCLLQEVDRPPVWMMRQAGRYLPEYRAIKEKHSTKVMMQTPELACDITLQPVHRLGVDAAILYSDILMIPDSLGMGLNFAQGEGPQFEFGIQSLEALNRLNENNVISRLHYVFKAVQLCCEKLPQDYPLLGFAGAPFTVACYMIAGKSEPQFKSVFQLIESEPKVFHELMQMLARITLNYLLEQVQAGVCAVQIFDTWAGLLTKEQYDVLAKPYTELILQGLKAEGVPSIHFIKGGSHLMTAMQTLPSNVIGLDWTVNLADAISEGGGRFAYQGNFDPSWLKTDTKTIENKLHEMMSSVPHLKKGYIVNLGHGIDKDTPVAHAQFFVKCAQELGAK